jgi:hypothetical protein
MERCIMHYVTDVAYAGEYKLWIRFEDGQQRLVDLESHLDGAVFEPLKDLLYFRSFRLNPDIDTVVWPNHADFSPDFLYSIGVLVGEPADAIAP